VILATQEAEIKRIVVGCQPRQIVLETLSKKKKKTLYKNRAGGVAQGEGPEFKSLYHTHLLKINDIPVCKHQQEKLNA
jgi:hypothetical protein